MQTLLSIFLKHPEQWLSGAQLAEQLQISRTAIWKQIQQLKKQGYEITSHQGLGYQYLGTNNLDASLIQHFLQPKIDIDLQVFPTLSSTNDYGKEFLSQQAVVKPTVILADTQTNGHGRLGRTFYSPKSTGLYLSILLPLKPKDRVYPSLLTTGTGTAVAKTLHQTFPEIPVQLKWINDIVIHDKKCGGILTEAITDLESNQISALIVGIGLNLTTLEFPEALQEIAGSITKERVNRNRLTADLLLNFFQMYTTYATGDFLSEYRKFSAILHRAVTIRTHSEILQGTVVDFDYQGYLLLRDAKGLVHTLTNGEIIKISLVN